MKRYSGPRQSKESSLPAQTPIMNAAAVAYLEGSLTDAMSVGASIAPTPTHIAHQMAVRSVPPRQGHRTIAATLIARRMQAEAASKLQSLSDRDSAESLSRTLAIDGKLPLPISPTYSRHFEQAITPKIAA